MTSNLLTHSRMACFRRCPRQHYLRYELGLRRDEDDSYALRFGSAFHAALEADGLGEDAHQAIIDLMSDPYDAAAVVATYFAYKAWWRTQPLEVLATEAEFRIPLVNPDTGRATPNFELGGKQDKIVRMADGRVALLEHKTTSRDFSPGSDYWLRLQLDYQISIYMLGAHALGHKVDTVLYDVTRRSALKPLLATPEEKRKYKKDGTLYASQRDTDETPDEFAARITKDIFERPEHYFARIEIPRLQQDIETCMADVWAMQRSIREAQRTGRHFRNPEACISHFRCDYLPICINSDLETNTPAGYVRSENVHPELEAVNAERS